MSKVIRI